jgi:hypothetical protein
MGTRLGTSNTTASTGQPVGSGLSAEVAPRALCAGAPVDAVEPDAVDSVLAGALVVVVVVEEGRVVVDVWAGSAVVVDAVVVVPVGAVSVVVGRSAQAGIAATEKTAAAVIPAVNTRSKSGPRLRSPVSRAGKPPAPPLRQSTPQDCAPARVILR